MYELKDKNILIVGLGRSGVAAAKFAVARGAQVTVTDTLSENELQKSLKELSRFDVEKRLGDHGDELFANVDLVVTSPGVPTDLPGFDLARKKGIPIIGEMELALSEISSPIIAVTGTNGKTTTTTLIGHLMDACGISNCVGGNIGTPITDLVDQANDSDWVVLEVSSFQLETSPSLRPKIAVWLNVTPDHLDRHHSFNGYVAAKSRLFSQLTDDSWGIYNVSDAAVKEAVQNSNAKLVPFDSSAMVDDLNVDLGDRKRHRFSLKNVGVGGAHNRENMLAAIATTLLAGGDEQAIQTGLESFRGLPHRLEFVAEVEGILFYNDSKGTNVGATERALDSFDRPIVLIAGGQAKGVEFRSLATKIERKVKRLVLIGEAASDINGEVGNCTSTVKVDSMKDAVDEAWRSAKPGDVVLLSPACASFDMFRDYAHRGDVFKDAVKSIADVSEGVRWAK
jgi:UDP-N-acetylmuramoylalanine--D-glutamate ligase